MKSSFLVGGLLIAIGTAMSTGAVHAQGSSNVWQSVTPYYGDSSQALQGAITSNSIAQASVWQTTTPYYGEPTQMLQTAAPTTVMGAAPAGAGGVWQQVTPYYGHPGQEYQGAVPAQSAPFASRGR